MVRHNLIDNNYDRNKLLRRRLLATQLFDRLHVWLRSYAPHMWSRLRKWEIVIIVNVDKQKERGVN